MPTLEQIGRRLLRIDQRLHITAIRHAGFVPGAYLGSEAEVLVRRVRSQIIDHREQRARDWLTHRGDKSLWIADANEKVRNMRRRMFQLWADTAQFRNFLQRD